MRTRESTIQWLEINLLKFATETGGSCGTGTAHRTAIHILDGLARNHIDSLVEEARQYWDIKYQCDLPAHILAPDDGGKEAA
jgi:hypothetical protein